MDASDRDHVIERLRAGHSVALGIDREEVHLVGEADRRDGLGAELADQQQRDDAQGRLQDVLGEGGPGQGVELALERGVS